MAAATPVRAARLGARDLGEQGVEESVVKLIGEDLPVYRIWLIEGQRLCVAMMCQEVGNLLLVFFLKHRARGIQQFTIKAEGVPQGVQERPLLSYELADVRWPP